MNCKFCQKNECKNVYDFCHLCYKDIIKNDKFEKTYYDDTNDQFKIAYMFYEERDNNLIINTCFDYQNNETMIYVYEYKFDKLDYFDDSIKWITLNKIMPATQEFLEKIPHNLNLWRTFS